MIQKFGPNGEKTEVAKGRMDIGATIPVQIPQLMLSPEQKYEGEWLPGKNHPKSLPAEPGGHAWLLPIPEAQIER